MALRDYEAFIRQAAAAFDPNLDTTPGSPFDNKVIQPLARRLGPDPFSVDLMTFVVERLRQAYPMLATGKGDNITDLIVKPVTLLWDPIVRENTRVRRNLSFADPTTLTTDEADSLGGNFFTPRKRGQFSQGTGRILFATPQQATVTQNNFITAIGGLVYFPTSVQSIRAAEMLLNVNSDGNYYFDVSVIASSPGSAYDIDPGQLAAIANIPSAVQVTNLARFQGGIDAETPADYAGRLQQSLGEKSLVALRGIAAKLLDAFPQMSRLNAIGFNDPEMLRDIITGGGLGPILASGTSGAAISDGQAAAFTRRFYTSEVNFDNVIADGTNFVLTVISVGIDTAVSDGASAVDIPVQDVFDANTIDLTQQALVLGTLDISWVLRQTSLTLSGIPGGILFPNTANGEVVIPSGTVHVGGAVDTYVRGNTLDESTFNLPNVTPETSLLSGTKLICTDYTGGGVSGTSLVQLDDLILGLTPSEGGYQLGYATDVLLSQAEYDGFSLHIVDGPNAGTYRILEYLTPAMFSAPVLVVTPALAVNTAPPVFAQWRLFDLINVNLTEPKIVRVNGADLECTLGSNVVTTVSDINFAAFGVATNDTLRVLSGPNAGDYTIIADPLVPDYTSIQVDRAMAFTDPDANYIIFFSQAPGVTLPLIRIETVALLDSSMQPTGSTVPYALPVDIQSNSFQNAGQGVKHDLRDVTVGLVSASADSTFRFTIGVGSNTLIFYFPLLTNPVVTIAITPGIIPVSVLIDELNAEIYSATPYVDVIAPVGSYQFGVRPVGNGFVAVIGGTAMSTLFAYADLQTTADIRTVESNENANWWGSSDTSYGIGAPAIDTVTGLDVVQLVDGRDAGFYAGPFVLNAQDTANLTPPSIVPAAATSRALLIGDSILDIENGDGYYFAPNSQRHVVVGSRSLGSARVYFLEPTTFEVNYESTIFSFNSGATGVINFVPDPTMTYQQIPPLPNGAQPQDGVSTNGATTFTSASQDFLLSGINPGDILYINNIPLTGTVVLASPVLGVAGLTLIYSINDSPDQTVVFVQDDPTIPTGAVTTTGIASQINAAIGITVASVTSTGQLTFVTSQPFVIRLSGTANSVILGNVSGYAGPKAFSASDTSNASPHSLNDGYEVQTVGQTTLGILPAIAADDPNWPSTMTGETFTVFRKGVQRISTTEMASNSAEASLYYFDVDLVSQGAGDFWNISSANQMTATGFKSDGYYLTTNDVTETFSTVDEPYIILSKSMLEQGVDDDPRNATQITGQNLQVTYNNSSLVANVQNFISSETERTICASPLSRHLIPHFVRFDMTYFGGSVESVVMADILAYIKNIFPTESLNSSDVQQLAYNRGATKVTNPLTLIAVVYYVDRTVYIQRSQDSLSTGRLSAFFADVINLTRSLTGTNSGI
jgi:hypothetical protein